MPEQAQSLPQPLAANVLWVHLAYPRFDEADPFHESFMQCLVLSSAEAALPGYGRQLAASLAQREGAVLERYWLEPMLPYRITHAGQRPIDWRHIASTPPGIRYQGTAEGHPCALNALIEANDADEAWVLWRAHLASHFPTHVAGTCSPWFIPFSFEGVETDWNVSP